MIFNGHPSFTTATQRSVLSVFVVITPLLLVRIA